MSAAKCIVLLHSAAVSYLKAGCSQPDDCMSYKPSRLSAKYTGAGQHWSVLAACRRFMLQRHATHGESLAALMTPCKLHCLDSDHCQTLGSSAEVVASGSPTIPSADCQINNPACETSQPEWCYQPSSQTQLQSLQPLQSASCRVLAGILVDTADSCL